jgi:hypothetical protein
MVGYVFAEDVWQYALISIVNGVGFALFMPAANAQIWLRRSAEPMCLH